MHPVGQAPSTTAPDALPGTFCAIREGESTTAYQPLVGVLLAVAVGMVCDRYLRPDFLTAGVEFVGGSAWVALWWLLSAACLALWLVAWKRQRNTTSCWLLLISVSLVAAGWHHWNWLVFEREEISRFAGY